MVQQGAGSTILDYDKLLDRLLHAADEKSEYMFVYGFPKIAHTALNNVPSGFQLVAWLTRYYKNCHSVIKVWRSIQEAILNCPPRRQDCTEK